MSSDTMIRYVLNGVFEFDPVKLIILNKDTKKVVKIHRTSAQCLLLLIKKHKEIVSQKELLQAAWGEKSHTVTYNALYQCILNVRKNFVQVGCDKTIITTIPRKGLTIAEDVIIEYVTEADVNHQYPSCPSLNRNRTSLFLSLSKHIHLVMIFTLVAFIVSGVIFSSLNTPDNFDFRNQYAEVTLSGSACKFFINKKDGSIKDALQKISPYEKICQHNEWLFITQFNEMKSKSVLICDGMPGENKKTKCTSLYQP